MSYKNTHYKKESKIKKYLLVFALFLLVAALLFSALEKIGVINFIERDQSASIPTGTDAINLNPPTEEDLQAVEDNKRKLSDEIDKQQNSQQPAIDDEQKISVKPTIGYIEIQEKTINANGFISTAIEEGGTCTLVLSMGTETKKTTSTSLADAQSTVCGLMQINKTGLSPGDWTAVLSYSSEKYKGSSETQTVRIN